MCQVEVYSLEKSKCRIRNILRSYGVNVLAGARICPDAPTYLHPRCLGEKHGLVYFLTYYLESCRLRLGMSILFNFVVDWSC